MSNIEQKALKLVNDVRAERGWGPLPSLYGTNYESEALCRAIEQHEAYKQDVSDTVENLLREYSRSFLRDYLSRFIIPKPDSLADALRELADAEKNYRWLHDTQGGGHIDTGRAWDKMRRAGDKARAKLEARGLEIREKGQ
jgi:hypothetical protein